MFETAMKETQGMGSIPDRAVIVGGGIAGLTAGILLADHGVDVVIAEQHAVLGGYLQGFRRRGVRFETGLHYVGGCMPGQAFARYLTVLGVYSDLTFLVPPNSTLGHIILPNRRRLAVPQGMYAFADHAKTEFPHEADGIDAVLREIRACLNVISWLNLRERDSDMEAFHAYATTSVDSVLRRHMSDPELIAVFSAFCFSTAMLPTECPFVVFTVITSTMLSSCCAIRGGGSELVAVLRRRFESLGGKVITGNGAGSVVVEGKRVSAVGLKDGTVLDLDLLISTCHPIETVRFTGRENFSPSFLENLDSLKMSNGSFKAYLELNAPLELPGQDRFFMSDADWPLGVYVASPSAIDSSYEGRHALEILAWQDFSEVERWQHSSRGNRPPEYEAFKKETTDRLVKRVSGEFPDIASSIKHCYTSSPLTNLDYVRSARGGAMGVKQDISQRGKRRVRPRNRLRNLFLAGQSVSFPGILGAVVGATELCDGLLGNDVDLFRELRECR